MGEQNHTILIVDDSPDDIRFLVESLRDDYKVMVATSGAEALEVLSKGEKPEAILLDVNMPGMNGYDTCRAINADHRIENVNVIFVSAHDSIEEKLQGYEAGGSDYVIKPFDPVELRKKLKLAITNRQEKIKLAEEKEQAMSAAMTAMSSSGELGAIMDFYRECFAVGGIEELGMLIVKCTYNGYGLNCVVQIRTEEKNYNFSSQGTVSPLEDELLYLLKDAGRLNEVRQRLILNYDEVSMLVKNMPESVVLRGRIRDNVAMLMEGAMARLHARAVSVGQIEQLFDKTKERLVKLVGEQQQQKVRSMVIIDEMLDELRERFALINLSEEEEMYLVTIINKAMNQMQDLLDSSAETDKMYETVLKDLMKLRG